MDIFNDAVQKIGRKPGFVAAILDIPRSHFNRLLKEYDWCSRENLKKLALKGPFSKKEFLEKLWKEITRD